MFCSTPTLSGTHVPRIRFKKDNTRSDESPYLFLMYIHTSLESTQKINFHCQQKVINCENILLTTQ